MPLFVTPNEFHGTDSQRINQAVAHARQHGMRVRIPRMNYLPQPDEPAERWVLDEAILLPSDTTIELVDCHLKLSDQCRDNFFRSANCGLGIDVVEPARNIHIVGIGQVTLEGADHPRATGDSAKNLGQTYFAGAAYGTDAGKPGQSQTGDWRNIGILMANVTSFSVQNITLVDYHCWGMSFEFCSQGTLRDIRFNATGKKTIDGQVHTIYNQDGLDLRQGCHDILIENITGQSGDDLIALTAIGAMKDSVAGSLERTMVSGLQADAARQGIHHVTIRNVRGRCEGGHHIVRLLNTGGEPLYDIHIDGVIDTTLPGQKQAKAAVKIGELKNYGGLNPLGTTHSLIINNVIASTKNAVTVGGSLSDAIISNVILKHDQGQPVHYESGEENIRNLTIANTLTTITA